ncbi:hypothetical protein F52700_6601 [Fusarium sp. NRRL 52700]|nr:hypothetical protein F52700_6601 [Fusarium sp. NRRL 52700]
MDPITAVGLIASIAQIIDATTKVLRYLNDVKNAPKARARVAQEASLLLALLTNLRYRLEDTDAKDPWVQGVMTLGMAGGPLDQFREALEELAGKLQSSGTAKSVGKALSWHFEKKEVDDFLNRMERLKSFIALALQGDVLDVVRAVKADTNKIPSLQMDVLSVKDGVERLQIAGLAQSTDKQREKILTWISTDNSRESFKNKLQQRQPGTGSWFLEDPTFQEWMTGRGKVLWCPGIPGAGKTILACVAMNELEEKFGHDLQKSAGCVFCDYKDISATTPFRLIANLLSQVLFGQVDLPENVTKLYEKHENGDSRPTLDELVTLLQELGKAKTIYIIVDALDECSDKDDSRHILLQQLSKLQEHCNILMTSRSSVSISDYFEDYLTIEITAKEADMDKYIAGHLSARLQSHIKKKPSLYEEIRSTVIRKAKNMFLLVRLHMDSLSSKQTPNAVLKALQTLPTKVFDTYDKVMQRIEDQNEDDCRLAKKILMWLSLSLRPLTMKELQHAVAVEEGLKELGEDDVAGKEIIITVSAGLVSVATAEGVAQLVHYTAQEYFSQARILDSLFTNGHRDISVSCLTYLLLDNFRHGLPEKEGDELDQFISQHPLYYYAAHNWGHHARRANLQESDQDLVLEFIQREHPLIDSIDALHIPFGGKNRRYFPGILTEVDKQGVWLTSYFGLLETTKRLIDRGANINIPVRLRGSVNLSVRSWNQRYRDVSSTRTALTVAAWNGHTPIVRLLLEHGAYSQELDLNGAICNNHNEVVGLLLQHGAEGNDTPGPGRRYYGSASSHIASLADFNTQVSSIHWCALLGNAKMMELLLDNGTYIESETDEKDTPLILAAQARDVDVVHILLKRHAMVNHQNAFKETAMHKASSFHLRDATRYERHKFEAARNETVDPMWFPYLWDDDLREYKVPDGSTAFQYASAGGHYDIVQLLLDVDSTQAFSSTRSLPLLWAAKENSIPGVDVLLRHGAQVNSQDRHGRTALFWAAVNNSEEMARLLLENAADVDLADEHGATPLHMALECDSDKVLEVLMGHGASLSARTKSAEDFFGRSRHFDWSSPKQISKCSAPSGSTPLHIAVLKTQSRQMVRTLLDAGVDIDAKDDDGETPLVMATRARNLEMMQWLLDNHAAVNAQDNKGQCAVHKVVNNHFYNDDAEGKLEPMLQLLHAHGAGFNTRDLEGNTPLFSAVQNNPVHVLKALCYTLLHQLLEMNYGLLELEPTSKIIDWLLDSGHSIESRSTSGETPLLIAVSHHGPEIARLLASRGADLNARNHRGQTALFKCIDHYGEADQKLEMVRTLIELGAIVNDPLGHGDDITQAAMRYSCKIFDLLVAEGLNVNIPDKDGAVPLIDAISRNDKTLTSRLLNAGADVTASNSKGKTALHKAASSGSVENAELLVSRGARVAQVDGKGRTALHIALSKDNSTLTDYLLKEWEVQGLFTGQKELIYMALDKKQLQYAKRIADVQESGDDMEFIIKLYDAAIQGSSDSVLTLLQKANDATDQTWLIGLFRIAIGKGDKDTLQVLLDFGLDTNGIDLLGDAPIHIAARSEHEVLASMLLDAHVEIEILDKLGNTPLLLAVNWDHTGTIEKLLALGANASHADYKGTTALHLTTNLETAQALISAGANTNAKNNQGETPLHSQYSEDDVAVAQLLLESGADVNARDSDGRSPLHQVSSYATELLDLYLKYDPDLSLTDGRGKTPIETANASYDKESQAIFKRYLDSQPPVIIS